MDISLLVLTICLYILSMVVALLLGMTARRLAPTSIRFPMAIQVILLLFSIIFLRILPEQAIGNYLLLISVCLATALAGWAVRNTWLKLPLRIYLLLYLLLIPFFLWSPSRIFYAISGHYGKYRPEQSFNLTSNYYLVEQQSMLQQETQIRYKVIRKFGIYNKTLARDVDFGVRLHDIKLIRLSADTLILDGVLPDHSLRRVGLKPGMKKNAITRNPAS